MRNNLKVLLQGFLLAPFVACVTLPGNQESALILIPQSQETQMGEQAFTELLKKEKLSKDQRLNAILQRVGQRISAVVPNQGFKWEFKLIESKQMNAFCLPGGKVAFYTGILPVLQNEAAMAIVMGHEVAHAVQRHGAQRMTRGMLLQAGLAATDLSLKNNQHRELILGSLGLISSLGFVLPFSREHESEADVLGLEYAALAGYDPGEAVPFWTRFSELTKSGAPPEFLSTHPSGTTRISDLGALMPKAQEAYSRSPKFGAGEAL